MANAPTSRRRGRPVLGAICGFFLGLCLAFDLLMFGAFRLDSILVELLPVLGLIVGLVGGLYAPLSFLRRS